MKGRNDRTIRAVRRAQRRAFVADFIRYLGWTLVVAAGVAVPLAAASRLLGWPVGWELVLGLPGGLALIAAGALAWRRRLSSISAAARLDEANRLNDRVGTSLALRERAGDDPFFAWAVQEGEKAVSKAKASRAAPIRFDRAWLVWPAVGTAAVLAFMLAPTLQLQEEDPERAEVAQVRQDVTEEIAEIRDRMERHAAEDPAAFMDSRASETLSRLEEQLRAGEIEPDEARRRAAEALQRSSERARREAEKRDAARDRFAEQVSRAASRSDEEREGDRSEFSERLSSGDFAGAQEALERAMDDEASTQEREQLARELSELADRLDEQMREEEQRQGRSAEESLRREGVDEETIDSLRDETEPEEIARELEREGMDSTDARRIAERMARENLDRQANEQAKREAEEFADQARRASEQLREDTRRPDPRQQDREPGEQREREQDEGEKEEGPPELPEKEKPQDQEQRPESESSENQGDESGASDESNEGRQDEQRGSREGQQQEGGQRDERQEGQQEQGQQERDQQQQGQQEQGRQQQGQQEQGEQQQGEQEEGQQRQGEQQKDDQQRGEQPQQQPQQEERQQVPDKQPAGEPKDNAVEGMCDRLGAMGDKAGAGEQTRRRAEELSRDADRQLRGLDPSEREKMNRVSRERELERGGGDPPASDQAAGSEGTIVDSRRRPTGPDARERVLAEYYSDRPIDRDAVTRREDLSEVVQRAERQAERAIEQQTVSPQRRSYIRRVFDRVPRLVDGAKEGGDGGEGSGGED